MASIAAAERDGGCDRNFRGSSADNFERDGSVSERESIECSVQLFWIIVWSLALSPNGDDTLERPITLAIESVERIALVALFPF
jgi:hypothetical protein